MPDKFAPALREGGTNAHGRFFRGAGGGGDGGGAREAGGMRARARAGAGAGAAAGAVAVPLAGGAAADDLFVHGGGPAA